MTGAQQSQIEIQTVTFDDLLEAIGQGLRDFKAAPVYGLFFAGIYTLGGWYAKVLEGEFMMKSPLISFVTYDTEHHRIAILALPGVQPHVDMTCGLHHVAFTYDGLGDLMHTYNRLKDEHGITPEFCINHGPTTSIYYFDPDKNQIELQVDNVPEEKFAEYFENGEFTENPIGIKFDPDEMTARLAAGESEESLLKRPDGTPPDLSEFPVN